FVIDNVYAVECAVDEFGIANVTLYKLSLGIEVLWTSIAMDLFHDRVENSDTMPLLDKRINEMRADEAGASGYEYVLHEDPLSKAVKPETRAANKASSSSSPIKLRRSKNRSVTGAFVPASVVKAQVYGSSRVIATTDSEYEP